jgi:hypothetical protein
LFTMSIVHDSIGRLKAARVSKTNNKNNIKAVNGVIKAEEQ